MNTYIPSFEYRDTGENEIAVFDNGNPITEIKRASLINSRFRPHGEIIIGEEYPILLYWQQYSNHEDPERNAKILISMDVDCKPESVTIHIKSRNRSGSITSHFTLNICYDSVVESYIYSVVAKLFINSEWLVTYNPTHGEVEFLNIYPDKAFVKKKGSKKKYDCFMYESANNSFISIPHYHMDMKAYRNIKIMNNGKLYYLLEDENPVVQLLDATAEITSAGICSYMWDTHFGIRVCSNEEKNVKLKKNIYNASYRLFSILRDNASKLLEKSTQTDIFDITTIPILLEGVNTFNKNILDFNDKLKYWPFQTETISKQENNYSDIIPDYFIDGKIGYSDNNSLAIKATEDCIARWIYTSFGPEFGGNELPKGKRIKITCMGKILQSFNNEIIRISIRLRKILPDNSNKFIIYSSPDAAYDNDWIRLTCTTPKLDFDFDRVHFLLEHSGKGECRFDDFEIIEE